MAWQTSEAVDLCESRLVALPLLLHPETVGSRAFRFRPGSTGSAPAMAGNVTAPFFRGRLEDYLNALDQWQADRLPEQAIRPFFSSAPRDLTLPVIGEGLTREMLDMEDIFELFDAQAEALPGKSDPEPSATDEPMHLAPIDPEGFAWPTEGMAAAELQKLALIAQDMGAFGASAYGAIDRKRDWHGAPPLDYYAA